jgi:hypothetical protein
MKICELSPVTDFGLGNTEIELEFFNSRSRMRLHTDRRPY